jgi:AraC-like DNA-binding protein
MLAGRVPYPQGGWMLASFRQDAAMPASLRDPFAAAFAVIAGQLRLACGAQAMWKDADPARWRLLPPALSQHRHAFCRRIKGDPARLLRCCAADNAALSALAPVRRRCPFGLVERVIPLRRDGRLLGWCFLGLWAGTGADAPPVERAAPAAAAAGRPARRLAGIAGLHPGATTTSDPRLVEVRAFIDANLGIGLRANAAAARLGLSTSRFVHWFADAAGHPWSSELRLRVMARAADELRSTSRSVTAIGLDLGFASPASFTAAFTRHHGRPPAAWRRAMATAGE